MEMNGSDSFVCSDVVAPRMGRHESDVKQKKIKSERKVRIGEELTIDIKLSLVLEEVEVLKICYWNVCCTKSYLL